MFGVCLLGFNCCDGSTFWLCVMVLLVSILNGVFYFENSETKRTSTKKKIKTHNYENPVCKHIETHYIVKLKNDNTFRVYNAYILDILYWYCIIKLYQWTIWKVNILFFFRTNIYKSILFKVLLASALAGIIFILVVALYEHKTPINIRIPLIRFLFL